MMAGKFELFEIAVATANFRRSMNFSYPVRVTTSGIRFKLWLVLYHILVTETLAIITDKGYILPKLEGGEPRQ
jgi:hypothetical protein